MDVAYIYHAVGLLILIATNIVLGSLCSLFKRKFCWRHCLKGIGKGFVIVVCFAATYFAGYLNPDIVAISINGTDGNVVTALNILLWLGFVHYAKQVFEKLAFMLGVGLKGEIKNTEKSRKEESNT
jgi:hypothetical protein